MRKIVLLLLVSVSLTCAQTVTRWATTTGDVAQSGSTYTATIQQPATNQTQMDIDKIVVYCSVPCNITQSANGAGATSTAGLITPILPSQFNTPITLTFWTASNVGSGT